MKGHAMRRRRGWRWAGRSVWTTSNWKSCRKPPGWTRGLCPVWLKHGRCRELLNSSPSWGMPTPLHLLGGIHTHERAGGGLLIGTHNRLVALVLLRFGVDVAKVWLDEIDHRHAARASRYWPISAPPGCRWRLRRRRPTLAGVQALAAISTRRRHGGARRPATAPVRESPRPAAFRPNESCYRLGFRRAKP